MTPSQVSSWLQECVQHSRVSVKTIPFHETNEWEYDTESIRHKTNRFFQIIGLQWNHDQKRHQQIIIKQSEIGILGFIVAHGDMGNFVLVQAKIEPGNVNYAQIAPSCQATLSNLQQAHGGTAPLFSEYFSPDHPEMTSTKQSEQGTRFYKKRNENAVTFISEMFEVPDTFKWIDVTSFCQLLAEDFIVNTDARSILVTSNWEEFLGRSVFSTDAVFTAELRDSYNTNTELTSLKSVQAALDQKAKEFTDIEVIGVDQVENTEKDEWKIQQRGHDPFQLIHIHSHIAQREVEQWDQPIIKSDIEHQYTLYCARKNNHLYFHFTVCGEAGLFNIAELGPSAQTLGLPGKVILKNSQSDEGGRFFTDTNVYQIIDLGEIPASLENGIWLSLKQIQEYAQKEGIFTNEARSNISLLLSLA